MNQLGALAYADWRAFVNDVRSVRRSPGRIALWIGYAVLLGLITFGRVLAGSHRGPPAGNDDVVRADYFVAALGVMLALSVATGQGAVGIFRSRVEGRFVIGSPVAAPPAIAYLAARAALAQAIRFIISVVYFVVYFGLRHIGPLTAFADVLLVCAVVAAAAAIVVPRRLASGMTAAACVVVGVLLGLVAVAPALRDAVIAMPEPMLPLIRAATVVKTLPAWHPGYILLVWNPLWLCAVLALAAVAIGVLAAAGRDAYPELYALSIARIERAERWRDRRGARLSATSVGAAAARAASPTPFVVPAPRGVLVFVWKSIVEVGRRVRPAYLAGVAVLLCAVGFGCARFAADEPSLFATLISIMINSLLILGIGEVGTIASEVRRPLFWLARAALFERLCALALALIWRTIVTLELIAAGFAVGGGRLDEILMLAVGLPALVALLAGVGFAMFALFPSAADRRGPGTVLRFLVSVVLLVPPIVLYTVMLTVLDAPSAALAAAVLLALFEAGGLIGVAAWRLDGHVDRLVS